MVTDFVHCGPAAPAPGRYVEREIPFDSPSSSGNVEFQISEELPDGRVRGYRRIVTPQLVAALGKTYVWESVRYDYCLQIQCCPWDTDGDGDCCRWSCPYCGERERVR